MSSTQTARVVEEADTPPHPTDYITVDGLRMVRPYYFDFKCYMKPRWEGKSVIDIFSEEFPARDRAYYLSAFRDGRLRVEGRSVSESTPLTNGMCIRHFIHRHEPPVLDSQLMVLGRHEDVVAVYKAAGMPVHTAGQYRKNTVLGLLQATRPDLWPVYPTHRLDKPVSGLLLLATSPAAANRIRTTLEDCSMVKVYVARVQGVFPEGEIIADVPLSWDAKLNHAAAVPSGTDQCASSTAPKSAPKSATTVFRRLCCAPDGLTSLVECRPKTGRTHQIRVHLQHLGFPIANDTQYGGLHGPPLAARVLKRPPAAVVATQSDSHTGTGAKRPRVEHDTQQGVCSAMNGNKSSTEQAAVKLAQPPAPSTSTLTPTFNSTLVDVDVTTERIATASLATPVPSVAVSGVVESGAGLGVGIGVGTTSRAHVPSVTSLTLPTLGAAAGTASLVAAAASPASSPAVAAAVPASPAAAAPVPSSIEAGAAAVAATGESVLSTEPVRTSSLPLQQVFDREACSGSALGRGRVGVGNASATSDVEMGRPQTEAPQTEAATTSSGLQAGGSEPPSPPPPKYKVFPEDFDPLCMHCPSLPPVNYPFDLQPLWLHCRAYSSPDWSFQSPLPQWADDGFQLEHHLAAMRDASTIL